MIGKVVIFRSGGYDPNKPRKKRPKLSKNIQAQTDTASGQAPTHPEEKKP